MCRLRQLLELGLNVGEVCFERVHVRALGQVGATVPELIEMSVGVLEREEVGLQRSRREGGHVPPPI